MSYNDILVSVIVPTYNVEKFISRAIESIQAQTHIKFELIVVIDGSSDDSADIADSYAKLDKRITVVRKENGGVSSARNVGIGLAKGEYVCFVDPDDYVEPDYIEYMLNLAIDNDADISLTTRMFGTLKSHEQIKRDNVRVLSPEEATAEILYYHIPIGCYAKLFRKDFLDKNKICFIQNLYIGEGFNFNTTAFQYANKIIAGQRKTYFYYRENTTSAMTKFNLDKCENGLYAIANIRKNLVIKSKKLYQAVDFADYHTHADFFQWITNANAATEYKEMYERCRDIASRKAFVAFFCPVGVNEKIRALLMIIAPTALAKFWSYMRRKRIEKNK